MNTRYVFVTGGVVSSLGKGLSPHRWQTAQSARYLVSIVKLDPYLNVDPGTMSPYQHGKCSLLKMEPKLTWTSAIMNAS